MCAFYDDFFFFLAYIYKKKNFICVSVCQRRVKRHICCSHTYVQRAGVQGLLGGCRVASVRRGWNVFSKIEYNHIVSENGHF